jgi:hypothetical protein
MTQPSRSVLQSMEALKRDPKYKEILDWINEEKNLIGRQTNLLKSTDDMLRSAGRYQQIEDLLKYLEFPSNFLGG